MNETPCRHFEDDLSTWIFEGTLAEKRLAPLKGHLKTCASCHQLREDYQAMKPLWQEEPLKAPPGFKDRVLHKIAVGSTPRRNWMAPLSMAAAASVLAVMFWGLSTGDLSQLPRLAFGEKTKTMGSDGLSRRQSIADLEKEEPKSQSPSSTFGRGGSTKIAGGKPAGDMKDELRSNEESGNAVGEWSAPDMETLDSAPGAPENEVVADTAQPSPSIELVPGLKFRVLKADLPLLDKTLKERSLSRKTLTLADGNTPHLPIWTPPGQESKEPLPFKAEIWEFLEIVAP